MPQLMWTLELKIRKIGSISKHMDFTEELHTLQAMHRNLDQILETQKLFLLYNQVQFDGSEDEEGLSN